MNHLGLAHTALACIALALGAIVVMRRKGDRWHRTIGHLYVASMLGTNITALNIYRLFGQFGPFHVAALVSLATVVAALIPVLARRPRRRWFELHAYFMSWSYVGLVAAAVSEAAVRLPVVPFAPGAVAATLLVTLAGALVIHWRHGALVRHALQRAGIIPAILVALGLPRAMPAQQSVDSLIDRHRVSLESAVARGAIAAIVKERQELAKLATIHPENGLLLHYLGYAWYREATLGDSTNRKHALRSAEEALERSAELVQIAETHALLSTVIGQQIGRSPWLGMRRGSSMTRAIETAMKLDPENPRIALQQGINAYYSPPAFGGGTARAREAFERALRLFPRQRVRPLLPDWGHAEAWAWLGRTRARAGDIPEARAAYQEALRIDSTYAWVSRVLLPALNKE